MNRDMKRVDRQVADRKEIDGIIDRCPVFRLGMVDGDEPYVVPMNFGYADGIIYCHGAVNGRKTRVLSAAPRVCLEFDIAHEMITHDETACKWSQKYESVIAWGDAEILADPQEKRMALNAIMNHYGEKKEWDYPDVIIKRTHLIKIPLDKITAKRFL